MLLPAIPCNGNEPSSDPLAAKNEGVEASVTVLSTGGADTIELMTKATNLADGLELDSLPAEAPKELESYQALRRLVTGDMRPARRNCAY